MTSRKNFVILIGLRVLCGWTFDGAGGGASFDDNEFAHYRILLQRVLEELDHGPIVSLFLLASGGIEIHSGEL